MGLYGNPELTGVERFFDPDEVIVTKTDLSGKITYGNQTFYKMAGFTEKECLGQQHNIIRHPSMPRCVFKLLWDTLATGEEVFAYVNNRAKNGDHYWVFAHVTPSFDASGNIIAYHSNRRVPNKDIIAEHIEPLYADLLNIEKSSSSPKEGMEASFQVVLDTLGHAGMGYNQFVFSLGY